MIGHPGKNTPHLYAFSVFLLHRQAALCSGQLEEAQQEEGVGWAQQIEVIMRCDLKSYFFFQILFCLFVCVRLS